MVGDDHTPQVFLLPFRTELKTKNKSTLMLRSFPPLMEGVRLFSYLVGRGALALLTLALIPFSSGFRLLSLCYPFLSLPVSLALSLPSISSSLFHVSRCVMIMSIGENMDGPYLSPIFAVFLFLLPPYGPRGAATAAFPLAASGLGLLLLFIWIPFGFENPHST